TSATLAAIRAGRRGALSGIPAFNTRTPPRLRLDLCDVDRLGTLVAVLLLIGDLRALGEGPIAVAVDPGEVDEEVPSPFVRRDEPEPLVVREPLDRSGAHCSDPTCCCGCTSPVRPLRALVPRPGLSLVPALTCRRYPEADWR